MGKPTGFLEYERREDRRREPAERVGDWDEFHIPLEDAERARQGARCMNCGVPYCQTGMLWEGKVFGCPLHNLIPEWNDMIMAGSLGHALDRLLKANNFPEFTGRVCPAPCEHACVCGSYGGAPITIRDNELCVIEAGFRNKGLKPRRPPQWSGKKVCVVGSGPAGLAAADQLNRRGHSVTVVEREERPGGLLTYGIPNMKLPKDVVHRRIELMTDEGVSFVCGVDAAEPKTARRLLAEYDAVILCCGAEKPRPLGVETKGLGADQRRFGVRVQELVGDETGALTAVVTTDGDTLPCELLIAATGFAGCADDVCAAFGVEKDATVLAGTDTFRTNVDKVFAAGDMRRGQSLVVWAIAEGRSAAAQVDAYLMGYTNLPACL